MRVGMMLASLGFLASPGHAQVFVDAFAGRSAPEARRASIDLGEPRIGTLEVPLRARIDVERLAPRASATYGLRVGYWRNAVGIALDLSTLDLAIRRQTLRTTGSIDVDLGLPQGRLRLDAGDTVDVDVPGASVPTTATAAGLLMLRLPHRRLEPYAFAGPAYVITDPDLSGSWGLRLGGGVRFDIRRHLSLFTEVRHTRVDARTRTIRLRTSVADEPVELPVRLGFELRQTAVVAGVGLRF